MELFYCAAIEFALQKKGPGGHAGYEHFWLCETCWRGKSIDCRFMHVTMPPKAICWAGDIDIALFLLSQGWAEVADDVTEAPYVEAVASAQSKKIGIWGDGSL